MRKIPLVPTWLCMLGIFGGPFINGKLVSAGVEKETAESAAVAFAIATLTVAAAVLWRQRALLPTTAKPRRVTLLAKAIIAWRNRRQ